MELFPIGKCRYILMLCSTLTFLLLPVCKIHHLWIDLFSDWAFWLIGWGVVCIHCVHPSFTQTLCDRSKPINRISLRFETARCVMSYAKITWEDVEEIFWSFYISKIQSWFILHVFKLGTLRGFFPPATFFFKLVGLP